MALPLENTSHLCEFLSTDIVDTVKHQIPGHKEGYLTKRGKNFGGWKTRYFVLNDNVLEYYESVSCPFYHFSPDLTLLSTERRKSVGFDSID